MEAEMVSESLTEIKIRVEGNITILPFYTIIYIDDFNWDDFGSSLMHVSTIARNFDIFISSIIPKDSGIKLISTNSGGVILIKDDKNNQDLQNLELFVSEKNIKHAIGQNGRNVNFLKHQLIDNNNFTNLKTIELVKKTYKIFGEK